MKITLLGTGSPEANPPLFTKQRGPERLRPAVLIESDQAKILLDCGPDIRKQLVTNDVDRIDAVFLTHLHFDHIWGIADLDQTHWTGKQMYSLYANQSTIDYLNDKMSWLSKMPALFKPLNVKDLKIDSFNIVHSSKFEMIGFIVYQGDKKIVYAPDIGGLDNAELEKIKNADVLIADGQYILGKYIEDDDHMGGEELIALLKSCDAKKVLLMAFSEYWYKMSAAEAKQKLPANFFIPEDNDVLLL